MRHTYYPIENISRDYSGCCVLGSDGVLAVKKALESYYSGEMLLVSGKGFQRVGGDAVIVCDDGKARRIEVKTEEKYTANLFLELWSNKGLKPGWLVTLETDTIAFYFLEIQHVFLFNWNNLQAWMLDPENSKQYPPKSQTKNRQLNNTTGHVVPIRVLREYLRTVEIDVLTHELEIERPAPGPPLYRDEPWPVPFEV